jgi:hypothetical protein
MKGVGAAQMCRCPVRQRTSHRRGQFLPKPVRLDTLIINVARQQKHDKQHMSGVGSSFTMTIKYIEYANSTSSCNVLFRE